MQTTLAPAEPFTIPDAIDALTWAREIAGPLRIVAEDYQRSAAHTILAEAWQYEGETIRPLGPTLDELRARAAAFA